MHGTPIRVDHVGIAVESISDAEGVLLALGAEKLTEREPGGGPFTWAQYGFGCASRIELVEPAGGDSFLAAFLEEHGPGLHHVTLEVADVDAVIGSLEDAGVRVVDRAVRDTYTEAFVSPRNPTGALFQLMEYHDDYAEEHPEKPFIGGGRLSGTGG